MHKFVLLFSLLFHFSAKAEINGAPSIDWLFCSADYVLKVKVIHIEIDPEGGRKIPRTLQVAVNYSWKGKTADTLRIANLPVKYSDYAPTYIGKEILIFLQKTQNETGTYLLAGEENHINQYTFVPLFEEQLSVFKSDFSACESQQELETYLTTCATRQKGTTCELAYLDVPFSSDAHKKLYWGSSCYLIVPKEYFPEATSTF